GDDDDLVLQRFCQSFLPCLFALQRSFVKMIVPDAANMPPTPWQTEIFAPGTCAGAMPRICRTLSCSAYIPYMPECIYDSPPPLVFNGNDPPGAVFRPAMNPAASPFGRNPRSSSPYIGRWAKAS